MATPYDYTVPDPDDDGDKPKRRKGKKAKSNQMLPKLTNRQWWRAEENDDCKPHDILDRIVQEAEDDQSGRYAAYREYERLFGSAETAYGDDSFRGIATDELTQNELQNSIETLWTQVFKDKILPSISVSEADWDEWDRARGLQRWLIGCFEEGDLYKEVLPQAGAYMFVHGSGGVKVSYKCTGPKTAKIVFSAVSPRYALVDRLESRHGKPRSYFEKYHIDRWQLYDTYSEDSECHYGTPEERCKGIEKCTSNEDPDVGSRSVSKCDMVTVREAWHLPSGPNSSDGKHCIWINGCTLVYEEFSWDRFQTAWMRFGCRLNGFWGESAVRRLAPSQKVLDKLNKKLDEAQDVMGVPRILLGRQGNGVKVGQIDDIPGGILLCDDIGQVRDWNAQCATPELYRDRDSLPGKMRGLLGVSDFEAQQQIPQSMRDVSGAMLDRWVDQGKTRNAKSHDEHENLIPTLAHLAILQAIELEKMGYDVVVKAPAASTMPKSSIERLSFKDVKVDLERMKISVESMSGMSDTFAGKVDAIEKMRNAGVSPALMQSAERQLEIPDPQGTRDILASSEEIIFKNLTWMTKKRKYISPLPYDNLDLIVRMTTDYINWYRIREDADSDIVGMLGQYIDDAVRLKKGLGGPDPNAPPPMPTPGMPMAPGGPVPNAGPPPGPMGPMGPPQQGMPPMQQQPMAPGMPAMASNAPLMG